MGDVVPFPKMNKIHDNETAPKDKTSYKERNPDYKAKTLIISDNVFALPGEAMPFPSAPAVCPKYLKALEEQKQKNNGG